MHLLDAFCSNAPRPPATAQELARTTARLCRVLRNQILHTLETGGSEGLAAVAEDWRSLLFPEATDAEFADAYAQTITFGLIAARAAGAGLTAGDSVAERVAQATRALDAEVGLIPTALTVLCAESAIRHIEPAVESLLSLLAATDPALLNDAGDWLYFYEDFLAQYDPALRKESGSYYTPAELVKFMVRLTDEVLVTRLGRPSGFADEAVTVIDPAVGTGTFLLQVIDRIASTVEQRDGAGAVAGALRSAADRLVGFELQTGPYSVAQFRTGARFRRHGVGSAPRVLLADTLADPYTEEVRLGSIYEPISRERRAANELKTTTPVMVAIGNPPYRERANGLGGWVEHGNPSAQARPSILDDWKPPADVGCRSARVQHVEPAGLLLALGQPGRSSRTPATSDGERPGVVCLVTTAAWLSGDGFQQMRSLVCGDGARRSGWCRSHPKVTSPTCRRECSSRSSTRSLWSARSARPQTDETACNRLVPRGSAGYRSAKFAELETIEIGGDELAANVESMPQRLARTVQTRW